MSNYLTNEEPVFLVISEPGSLLSKLTCDFLKINSLNVELINLDQDFFLNYEEFSKQQRNIYKIIFIYGFRSVSTDVFLKAFDYLKLLNENQASKIPLILISKVSTPLEILDDLTFGYTDFLDKQISFLSTFLSEFGGSMVFLGQDILLKNKIIEYPLLLFFSAIKKDYIFDLQSKFYFQDENSFFNLIKEYLIKPHQQANFLIKGTALKSEKLSQQISYLYEQYFQKKIPVVKLLANEKKQVILQEFSVVSNTKCDVNTIIDQKIRGLIDLDKNADLPSPSEEELAKALEISRLQKSLQIKKLKAQNKVKTKATYPKLETSSQARKEPTEALVTSNFGPEFTSQIEKLFSTQRSKAKQFRNEKNIIQGTEIIKKSKKRKTLFWVGSFIFGSSFIFLGLFALFKFNQKLLESQLFSAIENNTNEIKNIDKSVNYWLFSKQLNQYKKLFTEENLSEALDTKKLSDILSNLYVSTDKANQTGYDLYKKTLEGGAKLDQIYTDFVVSIDNKIEHQKQFNAYLMALNLDLYQGKTKEIWQSSLEKSKVELKNTLQFKRLLVAFKDFILQPGKTNILVLTQDSSELRPTGGFLTEAIILSFENAALVDKQVLNISDLDARVYGRKEASADIKDLLGEEILYLHDSNWQADFTKSGQEVQWFIEQATGSKIDLVVALNSKSIREVVNIFGELKFGDNFSINTDNYLKKQEEFATKDYKSSSDQNFTWQLANNLLENFIKLNDTQFENLGSILINQLNQRELLLQSNNQKLQQAIEANSWSGKKADLVCPAEFRQENCLLDYMFQVETNVGINKINPYIRETIEHNLGISEKFIRHKRKIIFENSSTNNLWPLGSYRNYLRFYLNSQANLEKTELNGRLVELEKIKITDDDQGKEISMLVEIPKQSKVELVITYLVPNNMSTPFSYVFLDQKQAGIFNKKTNYNIVFDEQFKPQLIAPQATYQDKIVRFQNENLDHFLFAINFDK